MSSAEVCHNMYSPKGPGDKESTNEPLHTPEFPSPSRTNEKSEHQKRSACFKCGIPILLVLLCIVGVGVALHHYRRFPHTSGSKITTGNFQFFTVTMIINITQE